MKEKLDQPESMVWEGFLEEEAFELGLTGMRRVSGHGVPGRAAAPGERMGDIGAFGGVVTGPRNLQLRGGEQDLMCQDEEFRSRGAGSHRGLRDGEGQGGQLIRS